MINQDSTDKKPFLKQNEGLFQGEEIETPDELVRTSDKSIDKNQILGTWKSTSETLIFNLDDTYTIKTEISEESGKYKIQDYKILFYDKEASEGDVDFSNSHSYIESWASIENNQLILIYPQFPKSVTYEKAE